MVTLLKIELEQFEYSALLDLALSEFRDPSDQIRFLIRRELESRGFMKAECLAKPSQQENKAGER